MRNRVGITIPPFRCEAALPFGSATSRIRHFSGRFRETDRGVEERRSSVAASPDESSLSSETREGIDSIVPRSLVRDEKFIGSRGILGVSTSFTRNDDGQGELGGGVHRSSSLASSRGVDAVDTDQRSTSPRPRLRPWTRPYST